MIRAQITPDKSPPIDTGRATACAGVLLALLERSPRTWDELQAAGLSRREVGQAIADLAQCSRHRLIVGPLMVQIEEGDD